MKEGKGVVGFVADVCYVLVPFQVGRYGDAQVLGCGGHFQGRVVQEVAVVVCLPFSGNSVNLTFHWSCRGRKSNLPLKKPQT